MLEDAGDLRQLQVTETKGGTSWLLQFRLRERMEGRDRERNGLNTQLLPVAAVCQWSVTEKHNRRQMNPTLFTVCTTSLPPKRYRGIIAQKLFAHISQRTYTKERICHDSPEAPDVSSRSPYAI